MVKRLRFEKKSRARVDSIRMTNQRVDSVFGVTTNRTTLVRRIYLWRTMTTALLLSTEGCFIIMF